VQAGAITGILGEGDVTAGDAAVDLASAWMVFAESGAWADTLERYEANVTELAGPGPRGWAVLFGLTLLDEFLWTDATLTSVVADTRHV